MSMNLVDLDRVRSYMLDEIRAEAESDSRYVSPRLKDGAYGDYVGLMERAVQNHDAEWLAEQIRTHGLLREYEMRAGRQSRVPRDAHVVLAEGEFNKFYMRGVCLAAIELGIQVTVYRARPSSNPRPESEAIIGRTFDPIALLTDLRRLPGDRALGLPPGPRSGLSIRLQVTKPV